MDTVQLIHDFVDGMLDAEQEDLLFSLLNTNHELRAELKNSLALEMAMRQEAASLAPSAASTIAVFSKLGYTAPISTVVSASMRQFLSRMATQTGSFLSPWVQGIRGAVISSVVTALVCLGVIHPLLNNHQEHLATYTTAIVSGQKSLSLPLSDKQQLPRNEPHYSTHTFKPSRSIGNTASVSGHALNTGIAHSDIDTQLEEHRDVLSSTMSHPAFMEPMIKDQALAFDAPIRESLGVEHIGTDVPSVSGLLYADRDGLGLRTEVHSLYSWSFPAATLPESGSPFFRNLSLTVLYALSDNLEVGGDIRSEFFYQEYEGRKEDGTKVLYLQYPAVTSYGLACRYTFLHYGNMNLCAQVMMSGTQAGLIGRIMTGISYSPTSTYSFIAGIEGSGLRYHHQGNVFYTSNLGLFYGISFHY